MEEKPKRGQVLVNITKKSRTVLDKHGNVIEEVDLNPKEVKAKRAKKLGFE